VRSQQETNSINRVMKAWGIGSIEEPGSIGALARMVQDHDHFSELLRACEPQLRKDMYDAMSPNLNFPAHSLDWYIIHAKQHAESQQYPTMEADGTLKAYNPPAAGVKPAIAAIEIPQEELWLKCVKCGKESFFYAGRKVDTIDEARKAGWAFDEFRVFHMCPNCLDAFEESD
jgi:hypothetical protein